MTTAAISFDSIDALGSAIARAALKMLVNLCPELATAPGPQLDAVCDAMRAKAPAIVGEFLADAKAAPWIAEAAFQAAVAGLAHEGVKVARAAGK